ncbi:MAG: radical SAM protein [Clostridiales bacterium]|nr:radical SAM protein [Clostridiales bacterium]
MIYLYTLPGVAFNAPNISVPLIKGYLAQNNILSKQIDLSIEFFKKCVNSNYINKKMKNNYMMLDKKDKKIIKNIDKTISIFKTNKINSKKIIAANEDLLKYLNIYSNCFNINWTRKGLDFKLKINTIDDVLELAYKNKNNIFDNILIPPKEGQNSIHYLSVQFPFQLPYAIRFAKKIKNSNPKSKVIFGGDYVTHIVKNSDELMSKCNYIDGIIFFGEHKHLIELIDYFNGNYTVNIPNTIIRKNNEIIKNKIVNCTKYKKDLYLPSFDDLNLEDYISNLKLIPLTLNYGCYHSKCNFCSRYFYYKGYEKYDLDKIFMLIKKMYQEHGIEAIYFVDECVPPEILIKVAQFLLDNNIKIKWMVETRIDSKLSDDKVANLLYKSGCREISFGIESYNKKILKDMNKQIDLKVAKKVMKNFYEAGVSVSATFMIGYPTENIFNIIRTLKFIKNFKYIDTFGLGIFSYMRNSKIVNDSKLNEELDLNLIYRKNNDNYNLYNKLIEKFNNLKKIKKFSIIRNKILYRSEYLFLDRNIYSLNYKK